MSLKQFGLFALAWFALCAAIIEPTCISPYFDGLSGLELAFNGELSVLNSAEQTPSMDHFRVLCLLYFGLPCTIYLISQMLQDALNSDSSRYTSMR